jgi:hypothetical protein
LQCLPLGFAKQNRITVLARITKEARQELTPPVFGRETIETSTGMTFPDSDIPFPGFSGEKEADRRKIHGVFYQIAAVPCVRVLGIFV